MKLLMVFMLVALPLHCYADSGCKLLEDVVEKTINSDVSIPEYKELLQDFIDSDAAAEAMGKFKQCFLSQSHRTLKNFGLMMHTMYDSIWCNIKSN
ncbi:mammaglobin-B [Callithrix jacchus]|uniref:Secretoglobin family 2A member 1 n=1 Tax=Callithrix jacchus TaxID=9483 RepID=F7HX07_CALJA|nr:mammaglobin-B [Callithrix jacchus]